MSNENGETVLYLPVNWQGAVFVNLPLGYSNGQWRWKCPNINTANTNTNTSTWLWFWFQSLVLVRWCCCTRMCIIGHATSQEAVSISRPERQHGSLINREIREGSGLTRWLSDKGLQNAKPHRSQTWMLSSQPRSSNLIKLINQLINHSHLTTPLLFF
jgi:hypothetical protein